MRRLRGWVAGLGVLVAGMTAALTAAVPGDVLPLPASAAAPLEATAVPAALSVMTYNVEGLPWPVRLGRGRCFDAMVSELSRMRGAGVQPHVIAFQEAFSAAAKAVATRAGYRYVADGPARDERGATTASAVDASFADAGSRFTGEKLGKWLDSGLRIASDYPIVAVRRMAYPAYACAGFDCMANKGVLLAYIAVPGAPKPVAVIVTHLNSRTSSHVDDARSFYAYRRQLDALGDFLDRELRPDVPVVLAGDLNVGKAIDRRAYLAQSAVRWRKDAPMQAVFDRCLRGDDACTLADRDSLAFSARRNRDWQFFAQGSATQLVPVGLTAPFGRDARGDMLSDHVGYAASYRLVNRDAAIVEANNGGVPGRIAL